MIRGFFRMLRAMFDRRYRTFPWKPIGFAAAFLIYLFSPVDIIPDYIPFVGVIDDIVLLGFFLRALQKEVRRFLEWEKAHSS